MAKQGANAAARTLVFCRVRPPINEDGDEPPAAAVEGSAVVLGERGTFGPFDGVLDPKASQEMVYEACGRQACPLPSPVVARGIE